MQSPSSQASHDSFPFFLDRAVAKGRALARPPSLRLDARDGPRG